ncbi:MAG: hypothetical protein KAT00_12930 [Planctomycetes bacterium]|nr:hypothetical protein [Planctomycetota bacterium]
MEGVESAVGVFIVRVGLAMLALVWCFWNMLQHRALARRLDETDKTKAALPAETKAKIAGLTHQVLELDESLTAHINKSSAREGAAQRKAAKVSGQVPGAPGGPPPPNGGDPDLDLMTQDQFERRLGRG